MAKCAASFEYYLRTYVIVRDVYEDSDGSSHTQELHWEWWPHHSEMVNDLNTESRLIWLKARQISGSWLLASRASWVALFTPNSETAVSSQGQKEAGKFLDKVKFIIDHLPWPFTFLLDNTESLKIRGGGLVTAHPSTAKAGHGDTLNLVVMDEAAFHEYASQNYESFEPAAEHGQIVVLSSAGGDDEQTVVSPWFEQTWRAGDAGSNGFKARFYDWRSRPGRDDVWFEKRRQRLSGQPGALERQYPNTPDDAFRSMLSLRFDADAISAGKATCRPPIMAIDVPEALQEALRGGHLRIWAKPRPGIPYVMATDAAEGRGRDYCATGILEARTLLHVATLRDNRLEPTTHAAYAAVLGHWYNQAWWMVEANKGEAILYVAGQTGYPKMYWHETAPTYKQLQDGLEGTKRIGFPVTEHTRVGLLDDLGAAIASYTLQSPDEVLWKELGTFVVNKNGRTEAASGANDDMVLMISEAVRMARQPEAQAMVGEYVFASHNYAGF